VKYIGVGEGIEDLQVFNKIEFVDSFFDWFIFLSCILFAFVLDIRFIKNYIHEVLFFLFSLNFVYGQSSFKEAKLLKNDNSVLTGFIRIKNNDFIEADAFIIYKKDKKAEKFILKVQHR
jgi:hypothetical protein